MHWARVVPTEPDRIIATVARQRVILVRLLLFLVAPASPIVAALRRHDTGCTGYAALRRTTPTYRNRYSACCRPDINCTIFSLRDVTSCCKLTYSPDANFE
jgi:hypothetical protein